MTILVSAVLVFTTLCATSFIVVYSLGAQWWHNRIGTSLVVQSTIISVVLAYTTVRWFVGPRVLDSDGGVWVSIAFFLAIGVAEIQRSVVFALELRRIKEIRRKQPG